jgi:hypothetical protein
MFKATVGMSLVSSLASWIMLSLAGAQAHAGGDIGNGGNVLKTPSGYRVLDLVEAGVADGPLIHYQNPDPKLAENVNEGFVSFALTSHVTASDRLVLINILSGMPREQAYALLAGIGAYRWNFVRGPLSRVDDVDSALQYPQEDLVQAAVRVGFAIEIRLDIWEQLDARNRAALILHEVVYAYMAPEEVVDPLSGRKYFAQSSLLARQMVGVLFAGGWSDLSHYSPDGKPASGAVLLGGKDGWSGEIAWGITWIDGRVQFGFSPRVLVKDRLAVSGAKDGWSMSLYPAWDLDPNKGKKHLAKHVGEACRIGKARGPLRVDGHNNVFIAQFSQYRGKSGPVVYLSPKVEQEVLGSAAMQGPISQKECEKQLLQRIKFVAGGLLRR